MTPGVTIAIVYYDNLNFEYFQKSVYSALSQLYNNFEINIYYDSDCIAWKGNSRIKNISVPEIIRNNPVKIREFIAKTCNTEYLAFWDSDDSYTTNRLSRQIAAATENNADLVFSNFGYIDEENTILEDNYFSFIGLEERKVNLLDENYIGFGISLFKTDKIKNLAPFPQIKRLDWWVALSFNKKRYKLYSTGHEVLGYYRIYEKSLSSLILNITEKDIIKEINDKSEVYAQFEDVEMKKRYYFFNKIKNDKDYISDCLNKKKKLIRGEACVNINNRKYPYIIAEIGCNHNGDVELAKKMVTEAKKCGCDAVKFQLWRPDELATEDHQKELNDGVVKLENVSEWNTPEHGLNDIFSQIKKYTFSYEKHIELFEYCREIGIDYSSTPITNEGVDFLTDQKAQFLKISSMDVNNTELISYCIKTGLPVIISVGLADLAEIERVVSLFTDTTVDQLTILQCTSLYPPREEEINLHFMNTIKDTFKINTGYSDHSLGFSIPLAAIALGAKVIEKHFTLDKDMPGWDHKVSANPEEMKIICSEGKKIADSLGNGIRKLNDREMEKRLKFRRSAVAAIDLRKGNIVNKSDLVYKRPGTGISPDEEKYLIGRVLRNDIEAGKTIFWKDLI